MPGVRDRDLAMGGSVVPLRGEGGDPGSGVGEIGGADSRLVSGIWGEEMKISEARSGVGMRFLCEPLILLLPVVRSKDSPPLTKETLWKDHKLHM